MGRALPKESNNPANEYYELLLANISSAKNKDEALAHEEKDYSPEEQKLAHQEDDTFKNEIDTNKAMEAAQINHRKEETNRLKAEVNNENAKTELMRWIAESCFTFMSRWCMFVAFMLFMYFSTKQGNVEKEVIIALLGTTTISIVGLVGFIVKGLFGVRDSPQPSKDGKAKDTK